MGAEGGDAPATVCAAMVTTHTVVVQDVHTLSIVRSFWTMSLSRLLLALCAVLSEVNLSQCRIPVSSLFLKKED